MSVSEDAVEAIIVLLDCIHLRKLFTFIAAVHAEEYTSPHLYLNISFPEFLHQLWWRSRLTNNRLHQAALAYPNAFSLGLLPLSRSLNPTNKFSHCAISTTICSNRGGVTNGSEYPETWSGRKLQGNWPTVTSSQPLRAEPAVSRAGIRPQGRHYTIAKCTA
jgi:hypothetical protein